MVVFWILAALMIVVALAFVLVPLLRARPESGPSVVEANLEVLRSQRREIEADVASGTLPAGAREEALAELVERADDDLAGRGSQRAEMRAPWVVAGLVALLVPALVLAFYLPLGSPNALEPQAVAAAAPAASDAKIVDMVENLARKVRERPDDAQGWSLLARSMAAIGRFPEASQAYEHLARLTPGDPQVLADWADALGMAQGRTLAGRPAQLAAQALAIDPKHPKALALAGTAALDAGDFAAATRHWQALSATLPPDSPDAQQVHTVLAEIQGRAAAAGKPVASAPAPAASAPAPATPAPAPATSAPAPGTPAPTIAAGGKSVTGSVTLAPALAAKVSGGETLFIFARSEGGPRVPLAVVRATARELPLKFTLDDSQAMSPDFKISSAAAVRVEARISATGNASPQPGDLVGTSAVVKPGARDVAIVMDKVMP